MSRNVEAKIFYGIIYRQEELPDDVNYYCDWGVLLANAKNADKDYGVSTELYVDANKLKEESLCTVELLGCDDDLLDCVCVKESLQTTGWFDELDIGKITRLCAYDEEKWNNQLEEFCEAIGAKYEQPKWIIGVLDF